MEDQKRKSIGERVKSLRGDKTQDWLAQKLGVTVNTIGRLERGEKVLTLEEAETLAHLFCVSLDTIAGIDSSPVLSPNPPLEPGFGARLTRARGLSNLSQEDLGRLVNVNIHVVSRWESEQQVPSREQMRAISRATNSHFKLLFPEVRDEPESLSFEDALSLLKLEHERLLNLEKENGALVQELARISEEENELLFYFRKMNRPLQLYFLYGITEDRKHETELYRLLTEPDHHRAEAQKMVDAIPYLRLIK